MEYEQDKDLLVGTFGLYAEHYTVGRRSLVLAL